MTGWVLVEWIGRRGTALYGVAFLSIDLLLIGILACINAKGAILGQVGLMAVWAFCLFEHPRIFSSANFTSLPSYNRFSSVAHCCGKSNVEPPWSHSSSGNYHERTQLLHLELRASVRGQSGPRELGRKDCVLVLWRPRDCHCFCLFLHPGNKRSYLHRNRCSLGSRCTSEEVCQHEPGSCGGGKE